MVIGAHTFIVSNLAPKMELAENTFYEVKLKKAMKLAEYDIIKSFDLSVKMTWGKRSQIPSNVDELHTKAKQVANKMLGVEKMESLEEAVKAAKQKKTNSLGACWAYLVYNSKFNKNFGSGVLVLFNGKKVLIVNHKVTDFDDLEEKNFVVLKKFSVGFQDELIVSEESKIEVDKGTHVDT